MRENFEKHNAMKPQGCAILQLCNWRGGRKDNVRAAGSRSYLHERLILRGRLGQLVPVGIGGFVDAAGFAPTAKQRVDAGRRDGLVLARSETDEISGGEVFKIFDYILSVITERIILLNIRLLGL